jgi:hypothetical protein
MCLGIYIECVEHPSLWWIDVSITQFTVCRAKACQRSGLPTTRLQTVPNETWNEKIP